MVRYPEMYTFYWSANWTQPTKWWRVTNEQRQNMGNYWHFSSAVGSLSIDGIRLLSFCYAEFPLLIAFNTPTIWDVIRFWFMPFVFGVVWVALPVILLFFLVRWTIRKLCPKAFVRKPSKEELAREEWLAKIRKQHESQQEQWGEGQE